MCQNDPVVKTISFINTIPVQTLHNQVHLHLSKLNMNKVKKIFC